MANQAGRSKTKHKLIVRTVSELADGFVEYTCTQIKPGDVDIGRRDLSEAPEDGWKSHEQYLADTPEAFVRIKTSLNNRYRVGDEMIVITVPAR